MDNSRMILTEANSLERHDTDQGGALADLEESERGPSKRLKLSSPNHFGKTTYDETSYRIVPGLWFPHGNVVFLVPEGTGPETRYVAFRVHSDLLARRSVFFREMFEHALPSEKDGLIEGCPVIHVQDDRVAFDALMRALYDGTVFDHADPASSEDALHVFRLADKYRMPDLRRRSLACLSSAWPTTLEEYDAIQLKLREHNKKVAEENKTEKPHSYLVHSPVEIIITASATGAHQLLPAAYYRAVRRYEGSLAKAFKENASDNDSVYHRLPRADFVRIIGMREILMERSLSLLHDLQTYAFSVDCGIRTCPVLVRQVTLNRHKTALVFPRSSPWSPLEMARHLTAGFKKSGICEHCKVQTQRLITSFRLDVWSKLPQILELGDWEKLREGVKQDEGTVESSALS